MLTKILRGEQMMNYRETLLMKKAFQECYLDKKCYNCDASFTHIVEPETPPLVLDFLDRDSRNGKQDNLRVLCLNCVYELRAKHRGWYRHREIPINKIIDDQLPPKIEIKDESLEFIPFENFTKTPGISLQIVFAGKTEVITNKMTKRFVPQRSMPVCPVVDKVRVPVTGLRC